MINKTGNFLTGIVLCTKENKRCSQDKMGKNFPSELSRAKNGKGSEGDSCSSTPECFSNALFKGKEPQPRGTRGGRTRPDKGERKRVKGERDRVLGFMTLPSPLREFVLEFKNASPQK